MGSDNIIIPNPTGFDRRERSDIMVLGVGGAGSNAVNHMFNLRQERYDADSGITRYDPYIEGVSLMICNTDRMALDKSEVPIKVQLGDKGLGAGNDPSKGKQLALESLDSIMYHLEEEDTKMLFITAGMGGGTGTGAAPVIAKAAKDRGILTIAITTLPLSVEGPKRMKQANDGLKRLQESVDSIVVIHNDNIAKMYGNLQLEDAFHKADDVLAKAAKGIAEIITRHRGVNTDFADVSAVMKDSGFAFMSTGEIDGDEAGLIDKLVDKTLNSPLLDHNSILGAKNILCNLSYAPGMLTLDELSDILTQIQNRVGYGQNGADINWGAGSDPSLNDQLTLTIVAVGFDIDDDDRNKIPEEQKNEANWGNINQNKIPTWSGNTILGKKYDMDKMLAKPAFEQRGVRLSASVSSRTKSEVMKERGERKSSSQDKELF